MLFNSAQFIVFFSIVVAAFFSIPHRFRWAHLLAASCYFYMVLIPRYILILFALILIDYAAGIVIEKASGPRRKLYLALSLAANIGMLSFFKYFNFVSANLSALLGSTLPRLDVLLPIGLSFHTFQSMSYTIEVYRGRQKAERHLGIYALYVLFFPQLVAGPIERPQHMLHQFREEHEFDDARLVDGLTTMLWGFFKKAVIADRLSILVDHVYGNVAGHNGAELAVATYFFAFQIYCDFSGYSDIAIGAARVLGFDLVKNFNRPYFSKSIAEFWQRWHISLSTWFRDYLYIPLGGNRVPAWRLYSNLFVVFLVSGLWHGANWTFLLWGAMHGAYLIGSLWTREPRQRLASASGLLARPRLRAALQVLVTFHLTTFAWIAFRADSISDVRLVMTGILSPSRWAWPRDLGLSPAQLAIAVLGIAALEVAHWIQRRRPLRDLVQGQPAALRWLAYAATVALILQLGKFESRSFIYFQF